jgi:hypothetical protein
MMRPVNDFLVLYLDSIDKRLLEHLDQDDEVHGPLAAPRKATGGRAPSIIIGVGSVFNRRRQRGSFGP